MKFFEKKMRMSANYLGHLGIVLPKMPETQPETKHKNARFRLACFTIYDMDFKFETLQGSLQYYAYGNEICPKTGRPHFQAFGYASTNQRWSWWLNLLKPHHFEQCFGTLAKNDKYCRKSGEYIEWGVKPMGDGLKRGLIAIKDAIESGEPFRKIQRREDAFEDCVRYRRALKEFEHDCRLDRMFEAGFQKKAVSIYIGNPGCLKSRHVRDQFPLVYSMPDNSMQWAGSYDGQSAVIFDDVGPGNIMSVTNFLRYTDGYPIEAPVKGGFVAWTPEHIFFTANTHPKDWWPNLDPLIQAAVERRITTIRVYKGPGEFDEYGPGQA